MKLEASPTNTATDSALKQNQGPQMEDNLQRTDDVHEGGATQHDV
jgi:hypothetical protein